MDAFLCTVMGWAPNFAPRDWSYCQGQLLAIAQLTAVFSLIGTIYGGDGRTTFALPDLRGRALIGQGLAPGLQPYVIGSRGGQEFVTLNIAEMPTHTHTSSMTGATATISIPAYNAADADTDTPGPTTTLGKTNVPGGLGSTPANGYSTAAANTSLAPFATSLAGSVTIGVTGGSSSHENRTPFLAMNWIIALQGIFPSRN